MEKLSKTIYILIALFIILPFDKIGLEWLSVTPALALFVGLVFALATGNHPCPKFNKKASKYLLQASVVGLGFGMNLNESLKSGSEGMLFTIVSTVGVVCLGVLVGYWLHINRKTSYLVASGTAICGGSAIAAVGPVIKANEEEMAVALGVIFILNAIALFIFPPIGHYFDMTQTEFGTWAAIAIHDTSSVVGAGDAYGPVALEVATMVKLTRALWIIPLALVTIFVFPNDNPDQRRKIAIPWFIFLFILAMVVNTYVGLPTDVTRWLVWAAKRGMVLTLFFIGASLSVKTIKSVGAKPLILAVILWIAIGVSSFLVVTSMVD